MPDPSHKIWTRFRGAGRLAQPIDVMVPLARIELAQTQIRNLVLYPLSYRGAGLDATALAVTLAEPGANQRALVRLKPWQILTPTFSPRQALSLPVPASPERPFPAREDKRL